MTDQQPQHAKFLEHVLVPLLDKERALIFLRKAAPGVIKTMEEEARETSMLETRRLHERIARLRRQVQQASSSEELMRLSDPVLAPSLVLDPRSDIWETWPREDLRQQLLDAEQDYQHACRLLRHSAPGSLTYHRYRENVNRSAQSLLDVQRQVLNEWLTHLESSQPTTERESVTLTWDVDIRLQVPVVAEQQVIDFLDAEIVLSARTPRAFFTHTFAVVVLPPHTGLIPALRRVQVIQHFLPTDVDLIVVVEDPTLVQPLQQHRVYPLLWDELTAHEASSTERITD